ncbi:MAG: M23 family metallopeptidase [Myxococcales bacterium]|nr:M23 family metallopeptidase [Myxococcales bacterium]
MKSPYALLLVTLASAGCALDHETSRDDQAPLEQGATPLHVRAQRAVVAVRQLAARVERPVSPIALVAPLVELRSTSVTPAESTDEDLFDEDEDEDEDEDDTKGWPPRSRRSRRLRSVFASVADPCGQARSGDGLYCGRSLGGAAGDNLYFCRNGSTVRVTPCANGCRVRPPGTPDECAPAPGSRADFYLPLACGQRANVLQGHHGDFSHDGMNTWAYDFTLPRGTPVYAMAGGVVTHVRDRERPGSACWNGGGRGCIEHSNYVSILHADGTRTVYLHLDEPEVARGATVTRGQRIGRSGNTGFSTRPHLHVQRQRNCGRWFCQSIPLSFRDAGMLVTGERVTSQNCP